VPLIAQPHQRPGRTVETAFERDRECVTQIAVDVQRLVVVGLENADVTEADGFPLRAPGLEAEVDARLPFAVLK
jgi:hypothetical protein